MKTLKMLSLFLGLGLFAVGCGGAATDTAPAGGGAAPAAGEPAGEAPAGAEGADAGAAEGGSTEQ
jgi:hypothetical protein